MTESKRNGSNVRTMSGRRRKPGAPDGRTAQEVRQPEDIDDVYAKLADSVAVLSAAGITESPTTSAHMGGKRTTRSNI